MNEKETPCDLDRNSVYVEGGAMLRHYSITRTSILSVSFTLAFGIGAYTFVQSDKNVVVFLVLMEILLMIIAIYASVKLSSVIKDLRIRLMSFESGQPLRLHRAINDIWVSGEVNLDFLDKLCVVIVLLFNFGLVFAHFYVVN